MGKATENFAIKIDLYGKNSPKVMPLGPIGLKETKQLIWTTGQETVPINIFTLREIGKTRSFGYVCVSQFA